VRRGEVYAYEPVLSRPRQSTKRLIVSADAINAVDELSTVLTLHLNDEDPGGLLSVRIAEHGWASVLTIGESLRRRMGERIGIATPDEMERVDSALRAALDL